MLTLRPLLLGGGGIAASSGNQCLHIRQWWFNKPICSILGDLLLPATNREHSSVGHRKLLRDWAIHGYQPGGGSWVDTSYVRIKTIIGDDTTGLTRS